MPRSQWWSYRLCCWYLDEIHNHSLIELFTTRLFEGWCACIGLLLVPPALVIDLIWFFMTDEASTSIPHQADQRGALSRSDRAARAQSIYAEDLAMAEMIADEDTRAMAIAHANRKYNARLFEIMQEE